MYLEGIAIEADPENNQDNGPETDGVENEDAFDRALEGAKRRRIEKAT
jgi:hypothetical protein